MTGRHPKTLNVCGPCGQDASPLQTWTLRTGRLTSSNIRPVTWRLGALRWREFPVAPRRRNALQRRSDGCCEARDRSRMSRRCACRADNGSSSNHHILAPETSPSVLQTNSMVAATNHKIFEMTFSASGSVGISWRCSMGRRIGAPPWIGGLRRKRGRGSPVLQPNAYSITSSARSSILGGTVRPSALAVVILMHSSNRVGCSIGKSAGLAPFRILSTKVAAPRYMSERRAP